MKGRTGRSGGGVNTEDVREDFREEREGQRRFAMGCGFLESSSPGGGRERGVRDRDS